MFSRLVDSGFSLSDYAWTVGPWVVIFGVIGVGDKLWRRWNVPVKLRVRSWAAEHGWEIADDDPRLRVFTTSLLAGQQPARHRRLVHDLIACRDDDVPAYSFTYRWQWVGDRLRTAVPARGATMGGRRTAHLVAMPLGRIVARVQVTPEGTVSALAQAFRGQDLQFESSEFNRTFRIVADDDRAAHAILHPRLMQQLLDGPGRRTSWRIANGWVFAWVDGPTRVENIQPMLDVVTAVRTSLPTFVGTPLAPGRPVA